MRTPFDDHTRRRIHLLRHAEAAYQRDDGTPAPDSRMVGLTERGRSEASAMAKLLGELELDFALCSGLPRTRETAGIVIGERPLELAIEPDLEEIRPGSAWQRPIHELAYPFRDPEGQFIEGERIDEFSGRVQSAFERTVRAGSWRNALFVCHGGTNRAILSWALGAGLEALNTIEQDSCCLNIIDVDVTDEGGEVKRRFVRAVNLTSYDLTKREIRLTTMEHTALAVVKRRS